VNIWCPCGNAAAHLGSYLYCVAAGTPKNLIKHACVTYFPTQVLSDQKIFDKKQQMSWSRRGAHLLLQVRTQALNEDLRGKFDKWYPGFNAQSEGQA